MKCVEDYHDIDYVCVGNGALRLDRHRMYSYKILINFLCSYTVISYGFFLYGVYRGYRVQYQSVTL